MREEARAHDTSISLIFVAFVALKNRAEFVVCAGMGPVLVKTIQCWYTRAATSFHGIDNCIEGKYGVTPSLQYGVYHLKVQPEWLDRWW